MLAKVKRFSYVRCLMILFAAGVAMGGLTGCQFVRGVGEAIAGAGKDISVMGRWTQDKLNHGFNSGSDWLPGYRTHLDDIHD